MTVNLVAAVSLSAPKASGITTYVISLARELALRGQKVRILGLNSQRIKLPNVEFVSVTDRIRNSAEFTWALTKFLRHSGEIQGIVHAQRPDDLLPFHFRTESLPKVVTLHGVHGVHVAARRGLAAASLYRLAERYSLGRTDAILCVSASTREHFQNEYPRLAGRLRTIPAGIDTNVFSIQDIKATRQRLGLPGNCKLIVFAGRFEPEKRPDWILDQFMSFSRRHPNLRLVMIGEGSLMGVLRQKVSANGAPVLFRPPVPSHLLAQYLGASDLLLIGSKHEGLPTVALEALACGTPVVATPVGILPELIKPGLNGFIAHSESEFQSSVEQALCEMDWNREECRASVAMFAWQNVAPAILEVYREITS